MGFLVAVVWIMAIADEVVNVLQVQYHFSLLSLSDTYLDLWFHFWTIRCHNRFDHLCGGQLVGGSGSEYERCCKLLPGSCFTSNRSTLRYLPR